MILKTTHKTPVETLLAEAEAIVQAEWLRLQYHRPNRPATRTATAEPSRPAPPQHVARRSRGAAHQRFWPTQRSPPRVRGVSRKVNRASIEQRR
jgi:hypothetical protein